MAQGLTLIVIQEQERQRQVEAHNQQLQRQQQQREQQQRAEQQREEQKRAEQQREQQQREQQEREQQQREQLQQPQVVSVRSPMHVGNKSLHAQCLHLLIGHARKLPIVPSATDPGHKLCTLSNTALQVHFTCLVASGQDRLVMVVCCCTTSFLSCCLTGGLLTCRLSSSSRHRHKVHSFSSRSSRHRSNSLAHRRLNSWHSHLRMEQLLLLLMVVAMLSPLEC